MAADDLTRVLDEAGVLYELLPHVHTESAAAEAEALELATGDVAKTLIVKTPGIGKRSSSQAGRRAVWPNRLTSD